MEKNTKSPAEEEKITAVDANIEEEAMEAQLPPEPEFDPSTLPDFVPDEEKLARLRAEGTVRKGFWGVLYVHSKKILNISMIVLLAGVAIGWMINSPGMTVACIGLIALCIVLNYTVARI